MNCESPNERIEPMTTNAMTLLFQPDLIGSLPVVALNIYSLSIRILHLRRISVSKDL